MEKFEEGREMNRTFGWASILLVGALALVAGCGAKDDGGADGGVDGGGGPEFGEVTLASLDEDCQGVAGLKGQAILDARIDSVQETLSYIEPDGSRVRPTAVTVSLTWPASPSAVCYPPYSATGLNPSAERVAIEGLQMRFATADGLFDEQVDAKAWLMINGGAIAPLQILAVTRLSGLSGTYEPDPAVFIPGDHTLAFSVIGPTGAQGGVGISDELPENLEAAVFLGRFAVGLWP